MASRPTGAPLGIVAAVAAIVLLWLAGLVWFRPWIAHNDFAIFRIALERELAGDVRLVGAHSRLDVFHPGPLREWIFAVPYWLSGRRAAALPATALALNAVWSIWTISLARRLRSNAWGVACALGLLVLVIALGPDLASPWNPHLAILPMYLACWSAVSLLARRGDAWIAGVCASSFAAQLHASVLILGGAVLAVVLVTLAARRLWVETAGAVGLSLVLWSGPIFDLRKGSDANLIRLRTVGAVGDSVGLGDALGHVSRLAWPATPLDRVSVRPSVELLPGFHRWWLLLVVVAVAGATWWSFRQVDAAPEDSDQVDALSDQTLDDGETDVTNGAASVPRAAGVMALVVLAIAVLSASLFVEPAYRYLYGPLQAGVVFATSVALGFAAVALERLAGRGAPDWFVRVAIPVCLVVVFITVPRSDEASKERALLGVEEAVASALEARPDWQVIEAIPLDLRDAGDLDAEVLDVALRRGVDARSRRTQLGLPAPTLVDGVFGVAMSPTRDCLLARRGAEEIVQGKTATGETFGVVAVDRDSVAYDECIGVRLG